MANPAGDMLAKGPTAPLMALADAANQLQQAMTGLVSAISPFVDAFAPAIVQDFNAALKDLQATIGSAFAPVVQIFAGVVREVSGALLPALQKLTPVITTLANAAGTVLVAVVRAVASALQALTPILEILAEYWSQMAKFVGDLLGVLSAVFRVIADLLGGDLAANRKSISEAIKSLVDGLRQAVTALVRFAAQLGVFFGFKDTVKAVGDALAKEAKDREDRAAGLKAAATNPQFIDVAGITRNLQLAAFNAQGDPGVREKTDTQYLKELSDEVRKIAGGDDTIRKQLNEWWDQTVGKSFLGEVSRFFLGISNAIRRFFGG